MKMRYLSLCILSQLSIGASFCDSISEALQPNAYRESVSDVAHELILKELKGIVLKQDAGDAESLPGITIAGLAIPKEEKLKKSLESSLGKPLTQGDLLDIRHQILRHFHEIGCHLVMVTVPEQDITDGILELVVTQSVLGAVHVKGAHWSKEKRIADMIQLTPGEQIDEETLFQRVSFVNRNPFRRAEVIYAPGQEPLTTDIEVILEEKRPIRIYMGSENTGVKQLGRWRNFVGFNWGNAFGLGDVLSCQFSASPDFKKFRAYTFNYTSLFSNRQILQFFGGYSHVQSDTVDDIARSTGFSLQLSGRYNLPIDNIGRFRQEMVFGLDYKRTNSNLEFTTADIADEHHFVNISQGLVGYTCGLDHSDFQLEWSLEAIYSPGRVLGDQKRSDYEALRPGAHADYAYGRLGYSGLFHLPAQFKLLTSLRAQGTWSALLPGEQLGMGGHDTVRGYEEREFTADSGVISNIELKSPPFKLIKSKPAWDEALHFILFFDHGFGHNQKTSPGIAKSRYLMSVGPGMRYNIGNKFSVRADFGFRLHEHQSENPIKALPNFSIIALF